MNQRVKLEDIFATPVTIRLLDVLLEKPEAVWTQSALVQALDADPATIRTALRHLESIGVVEVYVDPAMGFMKTISLRVDTVIPEALLTFYQRLQDLGGSVPDKSSKAALKEGSP